MVNNCFSNFICDYIPTIAILFFFGCSEVNSSWLITSKLANQRARKAPFTSVSYKKVDLTLKLVDDTPLSDLLNLLLIANGYLELSCTPVYVGCMAWLFV